MFLRKAFTVFVERWSTADRLADWPSGWPSGWIVDWRWFAEEAEAAAETLHAAQRYRDSSITTSLQVNAPS